MIGYIKLITGNLGGGKTSYGVEVIAEHLLRGGYVVTNIKLKPDAIEDWMAAKGFVYDPERVRILEGSNLQDFYDQLWRGTAERVVLCVIDEAAISGFNSRDFAKLNRKVFEFCTLARKLDIGMHWITQRPQFFDKQLRELCTALIDCRNMKDYRLWGVIPLPIPLQVRVYHQMIDGRPRKMYSEVVSPKKWVWPLYDSDALLGTAADDFASLQRADISGLQRINPTTKGSSWLPVLAALSAALAVSL